MSLIDKIVSVAKGYIGQEEIRENKGFKDNTFEQKMKSVGWYVGGPWCAFLAKEIWLEAFKAEDIKGYSLVNKYASGSALDTYHAFAVSKEFHVTQTPTPGCIVIWQEGDGHSGHAGVVVDVIDKDTIHTIEGNTNTDGSREGYIVALKTRKINVPHGKGLNLVGFVQPVRIA